MGSILRKIRYSNNLFFWVILFLNRVKRFLKYDWKSDKRFISEKFNRLQPYSLNFNSPATLNEKLQWLKLHDQKKIYSTYADKYEVRKYIGSNFGDDLLIPLIFETQDVSKINFETIPDFPCIIKPNHGFGSNFIVRDKQKINWKKLQLECKLWLNTNYYWFEREPQYKSIKPRIVVEKLLLCSNGHIPNDYKLHCINGNVQFVYVSIDREGINKRNIYDKQWKPLYFTWNRKGKDISNMRGSEIEAPETYQRMIEIAEKIALQFKYVRVDFYDVDGKLYFGEITQCHGGGFDQMNPVHYDYDFGNLINL